MNNNRLFWMVGLVVALSAGASFFALLQKPPAAPVPGTPPPKVATTMEPVPAPVVSAPDQAPALPSTFAVEPTASPSGKIQAPAVATSAPPPAGASPVKVPYQPGPSKYRGAMDPVARKALGRVGVDPAADAYWMGAINDPSIPAKERQDLIEDLNEDGISDPAHPAFTDLPLIASRLQLIEVLLPSAMDKVNADALREAHKDLVNMRRQLQKE